MLNAIMIKPPKSSQKGSWLKSVDMLGQPFSLKHKTLTGKLQTNLGGCSTLILAAITVIIFFVTFSQYFDKTTPVVTTSKEYTDEIHRTNLYEEELIITFTPMFINKIIEPKDFFRYMTPVASIQLITFNETTQVFDRKIIGQVEFVYCSKFPDPKIVNFSRKFSTLEIFQTHSLCPDLTKIKENLIVFGTMADPQFQLVNFNLYPCSLPDRSKCASAFELNYVTIFYLKTNKLISSFDFKNPVRVIPMEDPVTIDPSVTKFLRYKISKNKILDDTAHFQDPKLKFEYSSYDLESIDAQKRDQNLLHCTPEMMAADTYGPCPPYVTFEMRAKPQQILIRRNYKKISTILGEFGGILKLMSTFALIAFGFYNSRMIKSFILQDFFLTKNLFSTPEKEKNQKKIFKEPKRKDNQKFDKEKSKKGRSDKKNSPEDFEKKEVEKVFDQYFKSRISIDDLIKKLDFVDLLQEVFLSKDEEILVPLALIASELNRRKEEKLSKANDSLEVANGFAKVGHKMKGERASKNFKKKQDFTQYLKRVIKSMAESQSDLSGQSRNSHSVKSFMFEKLKNIAKDLDQGSDYPQEVKLSVKKHEKVKIYNKIDNEEVKIKSNLDPKKDLKIHLEGAVEPLDQSPLFSSPPKSKKIDLKRKESEIDSSSPVRKRNSKCFKTIGKRLRMSPRKKNKNTSKENIGRVDSQYAFDQNPEGVN